MCVWRSTSWKQTSEPSAPASKRRRRASPGPIIVIKDEPEDDDEVRFVRDALWSALIQRAADMIDVIVVLFQMQQEIYNLKHN